MTSIRLRSFDRNVGKHCTYEFFSIVNGKAVTPAKTLKDILTREDIFYDRKDDEYFVSTHVFALEIVGEWYLTELAAGRTIHVTSRYED